MILTKSFIFPKDKNQDPHLWAMHAGPYNTGIKFFDLEACLGNEGFHAHHVVHVALHNHVLEALKKSNWILK